MTRRPVNATENGGRGGKITPLREKFSEFFYQGSIEDTDWRFFPNFMPICPVTKKCEFIVHVTKRLPPFRRIMRPFGRRAVAKVLTREIWVRPIHMPVKFYSDPLRFARVFAKSRLWANTKLRRHAYAWQRTVTVRAYVTESQYFLVSSSRGHCRFWQYLLNVDSLYSVPDWPYLGFLLYIEYCFRVVI